MTLWAVKVESAGQALAASFPSSSRDSAVESAGRINDWVAYMNREHAGQSPNVSAEVIEWQGTPEAHAVELAASEAYMAEQAEEEI